MGTNRARLLVCGLIGFVIAAAGLAHFTHADFFRALVLDPLGSHRDLVNAITGVLQTALGLTFFVPRLRLVARWGTVALLVVTLPAAFNQVLHPEAIGVEGIGASLAAVRIVAQVAMIALVWWATKASGLEQHAT